MGNGVESFEQIPVNDEGASLYVPRALLGELIEAAATREDQAFERIDYPIVTLPVGNRSTLQALGNQPTDVSLLQSNKGWSAIAAAAVAKRVRGLAKDMFVFSKHIKNGEVEKREQPEHRLTETIENPNRMFTMGDMCWLLTHHLQAVGQGYWQKINDGIGKATELWPLPPQNVVPVASDEEGIVGYMVTNNKGEEFALGFEEVIRFWAPDPLTLYSAIGVLGPQATEYDTSRYMEDHLRSHFENDATPRTVITGTAEQSVVTDENQRAFHRKWRSMYNRRIGTSRSLPAFIPPGFDVKELSAHGNAAEIGTLKDSNREQMLAAFGVPSTVVGLDKNVNRATAEANDYTFDKNTIKPITDLIADTLSVRCARNFDRKLFIGFREFVIPDKEHELKREDQDARNGVRSIQQIIVDRGGESADASWGEFPRAPFNIGPYKGDFTVEDRIDAIGLGGGAATLLGDTTGAGDRKRESLNRVDVMDVDAAQHRAISYDKRFVGPLMRAVLTVLKAQRAVVIERLSSLPDDLFIEPRSKQRVHDDDVDPSDDPNEIARELFDVATWLDAFGAGIHDFLEEPLKAAANDASRSITKEDFVFSLMAQETVKSQEFKLKGRVTKRTLKHVADSVKASIDGGEGVAGVIKRLEPAFSRNRARAIARTEIVTAVQSGQVLGWQSTGLVQGKRWNISGNNTRDSHSSVPPNGQVVALGEYFSLGSGARASHPGDSTLEPADRVNCQCFLSPVLQTFFSTLKE